MNECIQQREQLESEVQEDRRHLSFCQSAQGPATPPNQTTCITGGTWSWSSFHCRLQQTSGYGLLRANIANCLLFAHHITSRHHYHPPQSTRPSDTAAETPIMAETRKWHIAEPNPYCTFIPYEQNWLTRLLEQSQPIMAPSSTRSWLTRISTPYPPNAYERHSKNKLVAICLAKR